MNGTWYEFECANVTCLNLAIDKHEEFGRYEFLQHKPWIAIPSIIILAIVSSGGTFGNILTILAVAFSRKIRHVEKAFVVNLALSDLYVTAIADPMSILGKSDKQNVFRDLITLSVEENKQIVLSLSR